MKRAMLACLLTLALTGAVRAQETADDAKRAAVLEEARQHVAKAKVHYDLGEFKEAADEYIIVYRLRPIPALLFNIAQAYRQGGMYEKAKSFYKSYLRESPEAKNRATIEQSIREMDELLAKDRRTREKPPTGVKEAPDASLPLEKVAAKSPDKAAEAALAADAKAAEARKAAEAKAAADAKAAAEKKLADAKAAESRAAALEAPAKKAPAPEQPKPPATVAAAGPSSAPARPAPVLSRPGPATGFKAPVTPEQPGRTWTWVAAGASVVALGGGAAFGYKTINGASPSDARTANMLFGAGAVLAIASAALFVFEF